MKQNNKAAAIPSGFFLNRRFGVRQRIPVDVTVRRWKNMLKDSVRKGQVVHLVTHPHNFIDGQDQFEMLEKILRIVADYRHQGKLQVLTQHQYCLALS